MTPKNWEEGKGEEEKDFYKQKISIFLCIVRLYEIPVHIPIKVFRSNCIYKNYTSCGNIVKKNYVVRENNE